MTLSRLTATNISNAMDVGDYGTSSGAAKKEISNSQKRAAINPLTPAYYNDQQKQAYTGMQNKGKLFNNISEMTLQLHINKQVKFSGIIRERLCLTRFERCVYNPPEGRKTLSFACGE